MSEFLYSFGQKVDLYSLGIIFFEMCYKPLPTGMERVKILGNLRLPEVRFPEDFDQFELKSQVGLLPFLITQNLMFYNIVIHSLLGRQFYMLF